ncbi:MAG: hypothetical protein L3J10_09090 [Sulfurimonas sp.]|nr:hypothetical protein [Sulfurimonas sp.]
MNHDEIIKQKLLAEPLSEDALKLACAIYNTYVTHDDLKMEIKFSTFFKLLNLHPCKNSIIDIQNLLEEINEPLAVRNFEYKGETIRLKFIQFCSYTIKNETIKLELSAKYLYAQKYYMLDSFLKS